MKQITLYMALSICALSSVAQSWKDKVNNLLEETSKMVDESKEASKGETIFKFTNGTDAPAVKVRITHLATNQQTSYDSLIEPNSIARFKVPAGKSSIDYFFLRNSAIVKMKIPQMYIAGDEAFTKLGKVDWSDYSPVARLNREEHCAIKYDLDGDGEYDRISYPLTNSYGRYGYKIDENADGTIDKIYENMYEDYGGGRIGSRTDLNGDGTWDLIEHTKRLGPGLWKNSYDLNGDGTIDSIYQQLANERTWDYDNDGKIDKRVKTERNEAGAIQGKYTDEDADGKYEHIEKVFYNEENSYLEDSIKYDFNDDGKWDLREVYVYNDKGKKIGIKKDTLADGSWDYQEKSQLDESGDLALVQKDRDGDGKYEYREEIERDEDNRVIERRIDLNGDGTTDQRIWNEYHFTGTRTAHYEDLNNDGVPDKQVVTKFDMLGSRIKEMTDEDGDGIWEKVTFFDYSCHDNYDENGVLVPDLSAK